MRYKRYDDEKYAGELTLAASQDKPKDRMREIVRDYKYGTPVMGELYGGFDKTRDFERQHYETRVIGKPSTVSDEGSAASGEPSLLHGDFDALALLICAQTTAAHSSYYYQLYRARAHAPSSIFSDPLYEKRPQTAPAAGY